MRVSGLYIISALLFCIVPAVIKANPDPFAKYLNHVPAVIRVISEEQSDSAGITIVTKKLTFSSRDGVNIIYGIMAFPKQKGKYPALLFLHGGNGRAEGLLSRVQRYATAGYVTFAADLPGICKPTEVPFSEGPWKARAQSEKTPRFDVSKGAQHSILVDAEIAAIEAFNLLSDQPNVDRRFVGITGYSWGGYSTTLLAGLLGKKVKAAYAVFGCGYYDKGSKWKELIGKLPESEKHIWLTYLDAGRRAQHMKGAYFVDAASNDTYFWPEAVMATLDAIPKNKNHTWNPNYNHKQLPSGDDMQRLYFDYYLRSKGAAFGKAKISKEQVRPDSSKKIYVQIKMPKRVATRSVVLYYSENIADWTKRVWTPLEAKPERKNVYSVVIPQDIIRKNISYYAYVTDDRAITVSSYMYGMHASEKAL